MKREARLKHISLAVQERKKVGPLILIVSAKINVHDAFNMQCHILLMVNVVRNV